MSIDVIDVSETSKKLKKIIEAKNMTAKDIQQALGLDSIQAVYKWMSPKYKSMPTVDHLLQLSKVLNCHMEDLLVIKQVIL